MSRQLNVPICEVGDLTRKRPASISVLRLPPERESGRNSPLLHTTSPDYRNHRVEAEPCSHAARDVAFAKWETEPLASNLSLDEALQRVVTINESTTTRSKRLRNSGGILKITIRFSDGSDITFAREDPEKPHTLQYAGYYAPNNAFDRAVHKGTPSPTPGTASAIGFFTKKGDTIHDPAHPSLPPIRASAVALPDPFDRKELFNHLGCQGNGKVTLEQCLSCVQSQWPTIVNASALVRRAFRAADKRNRSSLRRAEFEYFLSYVVNFHKVAQWLGGGSTHSVSPPQFLKLVRRAQPHATDEEVAAALRSLDPGRSGGIPADEACAYVVALLMDGTDARSQSRISNASKSPMSFQSSSPVPTLGLPDSNRTKELFSKHDPNKTGVLSLSEADQAVSELWGHSVAKPAILRAFQAADRNHCGFVSLEEFDYLVRFAIQFNNIWSSRAVPSAMRRHISEEEFLAAAQGCYASTDAASARAAFASMDRHHVGYVLFEDFCSWAAKIATDRELPEFRRGRHRVGGVLPPPALPSNLGGTSHASAAPTHEVLSVPPQTVINALFSNLDPHGNGLLSLADLEKATKELWPSYTNKSAIRQAHKATDRNRTGFVAEHEFAFFIRYFVHYSNLQLQRSHGSPKHISRTEYLDLVSRTDLALSDGDYFRIFESVDVGHNGLISFNDYCDVIAKLLAQRE